MSKQDPRKGKAKMLPNGQQESGPISFGIRTPRFLPRPGIFDLGKIRRISRDRKWARRVTTAYLVRQRQ
jgi:hypothetical protein